MMKHQLLLFTLLLNLNSAMADETKSIDSKAVIYNEVKQQKSDTGGSAVLEKLLKVQGVDAQYKACTAAGIGLDKISSCIWDGDGNNNINPLAADIRKKVQDMYTQESTQSRSPASGPSKSSGDLTIKSKQLNVDYMNDPAVIELSKVFQKKLESALEGDEKDAKGKKYISVVDHAKFIELYKTELGKTIINAFTSYCMEADISLKYETQKPNCKDEKDQPVSCPLFILAEQKNKADNIAKNIASLKASDFKSSSDKTSDKSAGIWNSCISSVAQVCYTKEADFSQKSKGTASSNQIQTSITRACTITDYVKSARKNLIAAEEQVKFYNGMPQTASLVVENAKSVTITDKNSIDAVTTVTSKDVEDSYQKKNKETLEKEILDCTENGAIKSTDKCKRFISTDTKAKSEELAEFGIRQYAQGESIDKLTDKTTKNKADVEKYLVNEGYDPKLAQTMTSDPAKLDELKDEIRERYKNERNAIIANMADKIKKSTTTKDGTIDATADKSKMDTIRAEISSRSADLKQLVHFNNVVSSYLEITTDNGKTKRNTASLFSELKNGSKDIQGTTTDQIDEIKKQSGSAGLKEAKSDGSDSHTDLSVETLNKLLKYSTEK